MFYTQAVTFLNSYSIKIVFSFHIILKSHSTLSQFSSLHPTLLHKQWQTYSGITILEIGSHIKDRKYLIGRGFNCDVYLILAWLLHICRKT